MWGLTTEAIADWIANYGGWTGYPAQPSDGPRRRSYLCRACQVNGSGLDDDSLTCWCCGSTDDLVMDVGPGMASPHASRANADPAGFGALEEVASLVG